MKLLKSIVFCAVVIALSLPIANAQQQTLIEQEMNSTPQKQFITHNVSKGEELHLLAGYYLLDTRQWQQILSWNRDTIQNRNRIYPGEELIIYVGNNWQPPFDLGEYVREIGRK